MEIEMVPSSRPETAMAIKLHPERKALWLAALRSGQYTQTRTALRTPEGFCCLGVACDVYDKTHPLPDGSSRWHLPAQWDDEGVDSVAEFRGPALNTRADMSDSVLTHEVVAWLFNLPKDDTRLRDLVDPDVLVTLHPHPDSADTTRHFRTLSALNDSSEWGFERIAQAIEDNL